MCSSWTASRPAQFEALAEGGPGGSQVPSDAIRSRTSGIVLRAAAGGRIRFGVACEREPVFCWRGFACGAERRERRHRF